MSAQKSILLIDDEVDLQQLIKIALKSKGYGVEVAGNGIEGLEKLKVMKPDLIILDMNMPKMGGLEFYQNICENDKPKFPVLVLTARANMEQLFKEFNIDGFMAKPFEVDELLDEVDTIIKKKDERPKVRKVSEDGQAPSICIAEDDREVLNKIAVAFLNAGYMVNPAQNGTEAIERISATVPDVALIKLNLIDIAGDIVIGKLKHMAKTEGVKCILYCEGTGDRGTIIDRIGHKADRCVFCNRATELVDAVNKALSAG